MFLVSSGIGYVRDVIANHDVIATQVAVLTWHDNGIIAVYNQSGRFASSMPLQNSKLFSGLHLAAGAHIHALPQHLMNLLSACMAITSKQNVRRYTLMHHSSHAADLLDDMVIILEVHWLATALSCSTSLLCFAAGTSLCAMYASMTAYDCLWTGHGLHTTYVRSG